MRRTRRPRTGPRTAPRLNEPVIADMAHEDALGLEGSSLALTTGCRRGPSAANGRAGTEAGRARGWRRARASSASGGSSTDLPAPLAGRWRASCRDRPRWPTRPAPERRVPGGTRARCFARRGRRSPRSASRQDCSPGSGRVLGPLCSTRIRSTDSCARPLRGNPRCARRGVHPGTTRDRGGDHRVSWLRDAGHTSASTKLGTVHGAGSSFRLGSVSSRRRCGAGGADTGSPRPVSRDRRSRR
jgi:hypothetical protein